MIDIILQLSMALLLGMRHGLDLDHLATIDSITRNVSNQSLSKKAGFFFSCGHGMVVMLISVIIGTGLSHCHLAPWLDNLGKGISIFFLLIFGSITIWNFLGHNFVQLQGFGLKKYWLRFLYPKNPDALNALYIALIGSLFAMSFDTFSQVALFSLSAKAISGGLFACILGMMFMLGMMVSDGLNGWFVSILLQRADRFSIFLSTMAALFRSRVRRNAPRERPGRPKAS